MLISKLDKNIVKKLQVNISHEYGHKIVQQNINKLNPTMCKEKNIYTTTTCHLSQLCKAGYLRKHKLN